MESYNNSMDFDAALTESLAQYDDKLLAVVAAKLFRARIGQTSDELRERIAETHANPPVIDRLLRNLPEPSRRLMAVLGRSRQPLWTVDGLLTLAAAMGHEEGFPVVVGLLDRGLMLARSGSDADSFGDFDTWFASRGGAAEIFIPPLVATRAAALPVTLRSDSFETTLPTSGKVIRGDGLDWLLRTAVARQLVRAMPVKLTQAGTLYKRDYSRFTAEVMLQAPLEGFSAPADAGLLALSWARAAGLLRLNGDLAAAPWPASWSNALPGVQADLFAGLFGIRDWDPITGATEPGGTTLTAGLLIAMLLADEPAKFHPASALAAWLWEHHPHWSGTLPKEMASSLGTPWVVAYVAATLAPLGAVEVAEDSYRLTDLGRHLIANQGAPPAPPAFAQTLLVQPNGEILAYRQGLTPSLIASLSGFAIWKQIGAACTLELTAEGVTRGLEDGLNVMAIAQMLDRHGMKPTPPNVSDLLRRWADKREKLVIYPSATLVEFASAAELDAAIARGIVGVRLTDRIGLTATGAPPDFKDLRLIGNRDYEARPAACVVAEDDGVTLRVDAAAADLLLDAEIARFAEPLPGANGDHRSYRMSPETLRAAAEQGMSPDDLEAWFLARSGESLPAAARLFLAPPASTRLRAESLLVLEMTSEDVADGLEQWPVTAPFVLRRLGPKAMAVAVGQFAELQSRLRTIGIDIAAPSANGYGGENLQHLDGGSLAGEDHTQPAEQ